MKGGETPARPKIYPLEGLPGPLDAKAELLSTAAARGSRRGEYRCRNTFKIGSHWWDVVQALGPRVLDAVSQLFVIVLLYSISFL